MGQDVLDAYLQTADPRAVPTLITLDESIRTAYSGFQVALKYNLVTYAIDADWHTWVCALNATQKGVCLRFLYGVLLDDHLGVLRGGSSVLMSWDFPLAGPVDVASVSSYVAQAVALYPNYKANSTTILASAHEAAARAGRRPKA